jgi:hypothetical protein
MRSSGESEAPLVNTRVHLVSVRHNRGLLGNAASRTPEHQALVVCILFLLMPGGQLSASAQ